MTVASMEGEGHQRLDPPHPITPTSHPPPPLPPISVMTLHPHLTHRRPPLLSPLSLLSLALILTLLPFVSQAFTLDSTAAPVTLQTAVPFAWTRLAPAPLDQPHSFIVALPQQNLDVLQQRLSQMSDPTHASYGRWMSKADVDALVSPPAAVVSAVTEWGGGVGHRCVVGDGARRCGGGGVECA